MTERTGLGPLEAAVLSAVDAVAGDGWARSSDVLDALDADGLPPRHAYLALQDVAVPWRRHLPLLDRQGNFGSSGSDPAADAEYTEVRPSAVGRIALRSERGDLGPVPLGLIDGTAWADGRVPPFAPARVLAALDLLLAQPGAVADAVAVLDAPALPTDGTVTGDLEALRDGRPAAFRLGCRVEARTLPPRGIAELLPNIRFAHPAEPLEFEEHPVQVLDVVGFPLGIDTDQLATNIHSRSHDPGRRGSGAALVRDLWDLSTERTGFLLRLLLQPGADPAEAAAWLDSVWPAGVEREWRLPAPMARLLADQAERIAADPSGLDALRGLLGR